MAGLLTRRQEASVFPKISVTFRRLRKTSSACSVIRATYSCGTVGDSHHIPILIGRRTTIRVQNYVIFGSSRISFAYFCIFWLHYRIVFDFACASKNNNFFHHKEPLCTRKSRTLARKVFSMTIFFDCHARNNGRNFWPLQTKCLILQHQLIINLLQS